MALIMPPQKESFASGFKESRSVRNVESLSCTDQSSLYINNRQALASGKKVVVAASNLPTIFLTPNSKSKTPKKGGEKQAFLQAVQKHSDARRARPEE